MVQKISTSKHVLDKAGSPGQTRAQDIFEQFDQEQYDKNKYGEKSFDESTTKDQLVSHDLYVHTHRLNLVDQLSEQICKLGSMLESTGEKLEKSGHTNIAGILHRMGMRLEHFKSRTAKLDS